MKPIVLLVLVLSCISFSFASISFYGTTLDKDAYVEGETMEVSYNLVNRAEKVREDLLVTFEIKRESDLSLFFSTTVPLSFAPYEFKKLTQELELSELNSGDYILSLTLSSASGSPIAFIHKEFEYTSLSYDVPQVYFETSPYLRIYYEYLDGRQRFEESYANQGKPVVPTSPFEVKFTLNSPQSLVSEKEVLVKLETSYSYEDDFRETIYESPLTLSSLPQDISLDVMYNKSGTYDLAVLILDPISGLVLAKKSLRLVVMGDSASLISVKNSQDVYAKGEIMNFELSYVGSADAISIVKDAYITLEVLQEGKEISFQKQEIGVLPFSSEELLFTLQAPIDLEQYEVTLKLMSSSLGELDSVTLDYEKLSPQLVISPSGAIYDPSKKGCLDDYVCSDVELELGNCVDCLVHDIPPEPVEEEVEIIIENEENNFNYILVSVIFFSILLLVSVFAIFHTRRSKNE